MDYSALKIFCPEEWKDIMIAELDIAGFDMMLETENGVEAYIEVEKQHSGLVDSLVKKYGSIKGFHYSWENIQEENWNAEWEKNYEPVIIEKSDILPIIDLLKYDKKNEHGNINFVFLEAIGKPKIDCLVDNSLIDKAFGYYKEAIKSC